MAAKVSKLDIGVSGLMPTLVRTLKDWRPPSLKTELDYRDALNKHLREVLTEDARIEREYRHNGTTSDLYLCWTGMLGGKTEVFFELKRNLKRKGEFDRLVGQVEGLQPKRNNIVLVLIGELNNDLVARLRSRYADNIEGGYLRSSTMALIEVP